MIVRRNVIEFGDLIKKKMFNGSRRIIVAIIAYNTRLHSTQ